MSQALKLDRARQDLEYWQKIAEDSNLSPAEAHMARDLVRFYQAAVAYYARKHSPIRSGTARSAVDGSWANRCAPFFDALRWVHATFARCLSAITWRMFIFCVQTALLPTTRR
jgi:hypothetical protein